MNSLGKPIPDQGQRRQEALDRRRRGSELDDRGTARTVDNGEELRYGKTYAASFHKGLPHDQLGFVAAAEYEQMVDALINQDYARFEGLPLGANFPVATTPPNTTIGGMPPSANRRKMTSPFTGHVFDVEGVDAGALAMPPAPTLDSDELAAEMAELYAMALLRDTKFSDLTLGNLPPIGNTVLTALSAMPWFAGGPEPRRRKVNTAQDLFRGSTPGSQAGPWLSQYLLVGNQGPSGAVLAGAPLPVRSQPEVDDGYVYYGTQFVDQRSVAAEAGQDWLQTWASWLDAQNGVAFGGLDLLEPKRQFITTPRDLATYVHFDALYQAYHVACLLMIADGAPFGFDRGMPESRSSTRSAFASFGGPHVLSLVTEVATRALKVVWRQKWMHHRRARPEVVAALLTLEANGQLAGRDAALSTAVQELQSKIPSAILAAVDAQNQADTGAPIPGSSAALVAPAAGVVGLPPTNLNYLLPMAFPEGSPTHPAYGAGHATVAGACVTVLKAFFEMFDDSGAELPWPLVAGGGPGGARSYGFGKVYQGNVASLKVIPGINNLTVQGELDKLAANIAIGRNMAGVHYYSDYFVSLRAGERVAVSIIEEHMTMYEERVSMTFTSFDGDRIQISGHQGKATVSVLDRQGFTVDTASWYQR